MASLQPQSRSLAELGLPPVMLQLLTSHGMHSSRDVLVQSVLDIMELLDLDCLQAEDLLHEVAALTAPAYCTALQLHSTMHQHSVKVLTGLPALDTALRVGVPAGAITELVGPAGVGKSQFCYSLALQVALPLSLGGLEAMLMYIDTEGKFSSERLLEMAAARLQQQPVQQPEQQQPQRQGAAWRSSSSSSSPLPDPLEAVLSRVMIMKPQSVEMLQAQLEGLKQEVARRDIKLILLDSVAALLRSEQGGGDAASALSARGAAMGQQATALKVLAEADRIPVVVTNQVTARPTGPETHSFQQQQQQQQQQGQLAAALGTKWAHAVNVRLVLERYGSRRFIKIAKSPLSANAVVEYTIGPAGVQQVQGGDVPQALQQQSVLEMQIANEQAAW